MTHAELVGGHPIHPKARPIGMSIATPAQTHKPTRPASVPTAAPSSGNTTSKASAECVNTP
jgi:hypothetical protein